MENQTEETTSHQCCCRKGDAKSRKCRCCRIGALLVVLLVVVGVVVALCSYHARATVADSAHPNWHGALTGNLITAHATAQTTQLFKEVAASDAQIRQAQAIITDDTAALDAMLAAHQAVRSNFIAVLSSPAIDAARLESVRLEAMAQADLASKNFVMVAGKLAADLRPEQRQQLASRLAPLLGPIPTLSPR